MSNPIFDEDYIKGLLSVPVNHENCDALQSGTVQALIDLFDRKVTRDEFIAGCVPCLSLYGQVAKLWMLHNIQDVFDEGHLSKEKFERADSEMAAVIRRQAEAVIELVKRLQMCPLDKDPVH